MENMDEMVRLITAEIMRRVKEAEAAKRFLVLGKDPDCGIADCLRGKFAAEVKPDLSDLQTYDFVVLPARELAKLLSQGAPEPAAEADKPASGTEPGGVLDLTGKRLIHERALAEICHGQVRQIRVDNKAIVTQLAADAMKRHKITIVRVGQGDE